MAGGSHGENTIDSRHFVAADRHALSPHCQAFAKGLTAAPGRGDAGNGGSTHVCARQVGPAQGGFFGAYEREVRPELRWFRHAA
jgi:hypothetical protein